MMFGSPPSSMHPVMIDSMQWHSDFADLILFSTFFCQVSANIKQSMAIQSVCLVIFRPDGTKLT